MPTVLSTLQLDNHEICRFVDCKKIDAAASVLPVAELLCNYKCFGSNNLNIFPEETLQIAAFM